VKIVINSYAWIEHFAGSLTGKRVKELLENADELITPDIVLAEIARKYIREGIESNIVSRRLEQITANSLIVCLDSTLALESAKCYIELADIARNRKLNTPSLFDATVLATARLLEANILTGDVHFRFLPETIWI
jgi:predicted nucleic acid-binding protein